MQASIVIVTWNAGPEFEAVLAAIAKQSGVEGAELIVIDSSSRDGTRELAARYGARVERIPQAQFNHGGTRNLGIELATGEFVALLSQDALPSNENWLAELLAPFSNPVVAGVYSRVIPRHDATPLVRRSVEGDLAFGRERLIKQVEDIEAWLGQPPSERRAAEHFNNVSSCVRRSSMQALPFPMLSFGEDLAWAGQALRRGAALVYQPSSLVEHSHASSLLADFERHRADARLLKILFDDAPGLGHVVRSMLAEVLRDLEALEHCSMSERVRYGLYSPWLRGVQALGRWVGAYWSSTASERLALGHWRAGRAD